MITRKSAVSKKIKASLRVCLASICAIALALTLTPAHALESSTAYPNDESGEQDTELCDIRAWDLSGTQAENKISLLSNDDESAINFVDTVKLKDTNEVRWFDRIEFPEGFKSSAEHFYNILIEACDNDGVQDYLIDDAYFDYSKNADELTNPGFKNFKDYGYTALIAGTAKYESEEEYRKNLDVLYDCTLAVLAAFDRDHPEVFWLSGFTLTAADRCSSAGKGTVNQYLIIGGMQNAAPQHGRETIKINCFDTQEDIKEAITLREKRTQELLGAVGVAYSSNQNGVDLPQMDVTNVLYKDVEKVRFFNKWLTYSNCYSSLSFETLTSEYPLAFECISALVGQIGARGPVCEAYSRALKVLCDASGIPCVLVDGLGDGGAHMWNSVCIEGKWYGIDVTWNDPVISGQDSAAYSGGERENYFLLGSESKPRGTEPSKESITPSFLDKCCLGTSYCGCDGVRAREDCDCSSDCCCKTGSHFYSHFVQNRHYVNGEEFVNGPMIELQAYSMGNNVCAFNDFNSFSYSKMSLDFLERNLKHAKVSAIPSCEYTGRLQKPDGFKVSIVDKVLQPGVDYELNYVNNTKVGTAYININGVGAYKGTKVVSFSIIRANIANAKVDVSSVTYTAKNLKPAPIVQLSGSTLKPDVDYTVDYINNKQAGTAYVNLTGIGSYRGTKQVAFTIAKASVSVASVTVPDMVYTGKGLSPIPIVEVTNASFKQGVDYVVEVSYTNNKNPGIGSVSVVVRGIGSCEGATLRVLNFKIYPKKASLKKLTAKKKSMVVKWNKATSAWGTGYQIRYSTNSKFKSDVKNANVKKVATAQTTIKKLKSKKRYYVSIRVYKTVNGTKYYGDWSAAKNVKVK